MSTIPPNPRVSHANSNSAKSSTKLMAYALPSSAQMLADLRIILLNQIDAYKKKSVNDEFTDKDVRSINNLIRAVKELDEDTSRVATQATELIDSMTADELEAAEAVARKLLGSK